MAKVQRGGLSTQLQGILLLDGIGVKGNLRTSDNKEYFRIQVRQVPGYEKQLNIQVVPEVGTWHKILVRANGLPSDELNEWQARGGSIRIKPGDKGYLVDGTYFIQVSAYTDQYQSKVNTNFKYTLTYST